MSRPTYAHPHTDREEAAYAVDARLFDIDELLAQGLDDRTRATVPLIVSHVSQRSAARALPPPGVKVRRALASVRGEALVARKSDAQLWRWLRGADRAGLAKVWLDARTRVVDDVSNPQIGAPLAWQAGYTGAGVVIADLDTGYDATHPDLQGVVLAAVDFTGSASGVDDRSGHGTHTATTIAGSGAASNGQYQGVAPHRR